MHHQRFIINLTGKKNTRFFYRGLKINLSQVSFPLCAWGQSDALVRGTERPSTWSGQSWESGGGGGGRVSHAKRVQEEGGGSR